MPRGNFSIEFLANFMIYVIFVFMMLGVLLYIKGLVDNYREVNVVKDIKQSVELDVHMLNSCLPNARKTEGDLIFIGEDAYVWVDGKLKKLKILGEKNEGYCT